MKKLFFLFLLPFILLASCDKGDQPKPSPPKPNPDTLLFPVEDTTQFSLQVFGEFEYTRENWYCTMFAIYVCKDSSHYTFCEWCEVSNFVIEDNPIYADTIKFGPFYEDEAKKWIGQKLFVYYGVFFNISPQYRKLRRGWIEVEIKEGKNELHLKFISPP